MSDLISRQDALVFIQSLYLGIPLAPINKQRWKKKYKEFIAIEKGIENLPSAEPEIIRCKDCKKLEHCRTTNTWAVAPDDNWYCADGERRTE